ncbi:MAG: DNA polymerase III subunit gamma/tau [Thermoflexales bacterium]|nr:DNA polymerase III subunit gamma/tau [Thermoflexales bacterium]
MAQAMYRKWRPQTFDEVSGQEHVLQTLRNAIASGRIAHAYLFSGPRGTGKTTMARLLAKAVNCTNPDLSQRPDNTCAICTAIADGRMLDLVELDAASNRGIDEIRDLRDKINFAPGQSRYKVYIIDEVHMLTEPAFNALLKTLEEPPAHAIFVLATTDPQKVPATIVSRCQPFGFRRLTLGEISSRLQHLVDEEGLTAEAGALTLIARQATGSMRDAVSLLDQLAAGGADITLERAQAALGAGSLRWVSDVLDALGHVDAAGGLDAINHAIDSGADARQFARQIVEQLRAVMLIKLGEGRLIDLSNEQRSQFEAQAARLELDRLTRAIKLFNQAASDLRGGWQPQLPLELALIESLQQLAAVPAVAVAAPVVRQAPQLVAKPQPVVEHQSHTAAPVQSVAQAPMAAPEPAQIVGTAFSLEEIQARWPEVMREVKTRHVPTEALLKSCHLLGVEGETVILNWTTDTLKSKFESGKGQRLVEDVLSEMLDQKVLVRSLVDDPMIRAAMQLGAKVTPVQNR